VIGTAPHSSLTLDGDRHRATFELDLGDERYVDKELRSGCGGFRSTVEIFESFLGFMFACAESYPDGENADLFPPHIAQWCSENQDELCFVLPEITDEDGSPHVGLIQE